jgi:hypothetical protein
MGIIPSPRFYVYVLARPNGSPFYVGKGTGTRIYDHDNEARCGHQCYKCNVIRKIWRNGGQIHRYTVFTTNDEQEAFDYERELISLYGRKTLTNLTDGGEGASGLKHTEESKKKISRASTGRPSPKSPEHRRKISETLKGHPLQPHVYEKFRVVNVGREYTEAHCDNIALGQTKGRRYTFVAPDNTIYEHIASVLGFAKEHNIDNDCLIKVAQGKLLQYKGWVGWIEGENPRTLPVKTSYTAIAPDGTKYTGITNVAAFGKEHNIDAHQLRAMLRGDRPHAQGWIGWKDGCEPEHKHQPPVYTIIAPDGTIYRGVVNVQAFSRKHSLTASALYRTLSGQYKQYKGWTGHRETR